MNLRGALRESFLTLKLKVMFGEWDDFQKNFEKNWESLFGCDLAGYSNTNQKSIRRQCNSFRI